MRLSRKSIAAVSTAIVLLVTPASVAMADDQAPTVIDGVLVDVAGIETAADLDAYLQSDAQKTIGLDVASGEVTWVEEGQEPLVSVRTTWGKVCHTGNTCLLGPGAPYTDYFFTGAGTATGSWENRVSVSSGSWKVNVTIGGVTSGTIAKNTTAILSQISTVTKVKLAS